MNSTEQDVISAEQQLRDVLARLEIPEQARITIRAAASTLAKAKAEQAKRELADTFAGVIDG